MADFATKDEVNILRDEVYTGFKDTNQNISALVETYNKSHNDIKETLTSIINKSMSSDFNIRTDMIKEFEAKEKERRTTWATNLRIFILLGSLLWGAIWWAVKSDSENSIKDLKLESQTETFNTKIKELKKDHELELRILKMECDENNGETCIIR